MCWSVKQTKITVLLLLFCSVLCTHAQVCNRCVEMPDSGFISYRLEGEPAHRLFLQEDTLRVKVKGMGLFPPYTLFYVIAQDGCLRRIGMPNAEQTATKGIDIDLPISASLDGKYLKRISDSEIRISGDNRPYFSAQTVKGILNGMDLLWIYDGTMVRDSAVFGKLNKIIKDNVENVQIKILYGKQAYCQYGIAGINGAIIIETKVASRGRTIEYYLSVRHKINKKMRIPIIILLLASLFAASCGDPPMPPSDEEMIRHFATHEAAFRKVYEIMSESSEGSFHYPPFSPDGIIILDSMEQSDTSYESNDEQDLPVYGC